MSLHTCFPNMWMNLKQKNEADLNDYRVVTQLSVRDTGSDIQMKSGLSSRVH